MTGYYLKIQLLSSSISSGGEGRIGQVDREVVFDELGLPFIPGRRLKGLWRDAYRDLADAWQACSKDGLEPDHLFGAIGEGPGTGSAQVRIRNAHLLEAPILTPWLRYWLHEKKVTRDEVIASFACVRAQTAVDRRTGAPKENTLRFTRTLRPGLTFKTPLRFTQDPPESVLLRALALGAAALQHMGVSRTRGLGEVDCHLCTAENLVEIDLTAEELEKLTELPALKVASPAANDAENTEQLTPAVPSTHTPPTHLLRYTLTLEAPAVLPVLESDPNTVSTRRYLPGACLWGAAAWAYLRQTGNTPRDSDFLRAFVDGQLRFLPAFPESRDEHRQRLLPVPHSIRKRKEDDALIDYLEEECTEAVRRLDKVFARIEPSHLQTQEVETQFNYHHARAKDRRKGRALGAEEKDGGAFFVYESIQAGQRFQGVVLGNEELLNELGSWLSEGTRVQVGHSRSAQYGGEAKLEWIDAEPVSLGEACAEWWGFDTEKGWEYKPQEEDPDVQKTISKLVVTTLSPLFTTNPDGHPEARFPLEELSTFLQADQEPELQLEPKRSYTRTELVGGYLSHLRLPRQQWLAIAPGSVFEFEVKSGSIHAGKLLELERDGLGGRRGEGFGRVAVNRHGNLGLTGEKTCEIEKETPPSRPSGETLPECVSDFLTGVVRRRCQEQLIQFALKIADSLDREKIPSGSLLGRLALILRRHTSGEALAVVEKLRPTAQKPLRECPILKDAMRDGPAVLGKVKTLHDLLCTVLQKAREMIEELASEEVEKILGDACAESDKQIVQAVVSERETLVGDFLREGLAAMSRKRKLAKTTRADQGAGHGAQQ